MVDFYAVVLKLICVMQQRGLHSLVFELSNNAERDGGCGLAAVLERGVIPEKIGTHIIFLNIMHI